ncbi:acyltransferase family protein [Erythrobacter sp. NE805]|uniref:acyltransferase family protein n=1 Tax=Erythrobacter sp. NE805 TaxID=3389875 RepID=UPI00396B0FD9
MRPDHYHAVDVLRGLAAFAILVYHYRHMLFPPGVFDIYGGDMAGELPLYDWLFPFYLYGNWAVQVFWMISGFVFAKVYAGKDTPGGTFVLRRFARLYPLHFVTLLIVAALQPIAVADFGAPLIFGNNDAWHFVLNLFLASGWGLERGMSFNAPIWSVSVEILVYLLFWLVAKPLLRGGIAGPLAIIAAAGAMLMLGAGAPRIWQCVQYFFIGCALYHVAGHHLRPVRDLALIAGAAAAACLALPLLVPGLRLGNLVLPLAIALVGGAALIDLGRWGAPIRRLRFIGDSTYGTYLWNVPLQIAALLLAHRLGIAPEVWQAPAMFFAYLAVCFGAGWLSYVAFERPANRAILRWWSARRSAPSTLSV